MKLLLLFFLSLGVRFEGAQSQSNIPAQCGCPPFVRNAQLISDERWFLANTYAEYECFPGYRLISSPLIYCLPTGYWENRRLLCTPNPW